MVFDPSISFGTILNALALLIGFTIAFTRIGGRIDLLTQRLESVEDTVKAAADIRSEIATIKEQVTTTQRDIANLRRGEGFITSHRKSVDGQY